MEKIVKLGGFREPYLKNSETFAKRFRRIHTDTIIREDLLDLESVRDIKSIEILIDLLRTRVGSTTSYTALANDLQVSIHTVKHWLQILENLYIIFPVRPYHKNIARSILKESKYYLYDTGAVEGDLGAKMENTDACALLRELHLIEDTTGSRVALHYLRHKEKHEVDFLPVVDNRPLCMIDVKTSDDSFSPSLFRFHSKLKMAKPFQIVYSLNDENIVRRRCADYDTISFAEMFFSSSGYIEETPRQLNSFAQFLDLTVVLDSMTNPSWRLSGLYLIDPRLSHLLLADGPFETL